MTCECGLPAADRNRRHHRLSVYHRRHRRIRRLLSNNSIRFADIGDKFGITRERGPPRSLGTLGMESGRQRQEQRVLGVKFPERDGNFSLVKSFR